MRKGHSDITLVTIGDSITAFNQTSNKNWTVYAKEALNAQHLNLGQSGVGYLYQGGFSKKFNMLTADAGLVVFYGSFNDMEEVRNGVEIGSATDVYVEGANNSLAACMNYAYDYVKTNCPNAKIAVIAPAPWSGHQEEITDETSIQARYVAVMQEICESKGIAFLDLFHTSGMTPWDAEYNATYYYNADGCHPNDEGQKILASKITPFLQDVLK